MAYLQIQTNTFVDEAYVAGLMSALSQHVSRLIGKPEERIVVHMHDQAKIMQGGNFDPLACIEVRNLELDNEDLTPLAHAIAGDVEQYMGIPQDRIWVYFAGIANDSWSWHNNEFLVYSPPEKRDYRDF